MAEPSETLPSIPVTRRRLLRLAGQGAGMALLAPLLAACGGGTAQPPTASSGAASSAATSAASSASKAAASSAASSAPAKAAAAADTMVLGITPAAAHLDPRIVLGMPNYSHVWHVYESLVWRDEKMETIPWLAEKYEQVDPKTMKLTLRKGVKFHNGEEFNGETVKWTLDNIRAPESKSLWKSMIAPIAEVKILDSHTVNLINSEPNRALLRNLAVIPMMSPKAVQEMGDKIATQPVGTGPYRHVDYVPGSHTTIEASPDYWGKKGLTKTLKWRFIVEDGTRIASLEAGETVFANNIPPDQVDRVKKIANADVVQSTTARIVYCGIRCDRKPWSDVRLRQAMNYAINKDAIVKDIMRGFGQVANSPLAPMIFASSTELKPWPYDPNKAKALLKEAGYGGEPLNFGIANGRYIADKQIGEAITGYLQEVGIKVQPDAPEFGTMIAEVFKNDKTKYDMHMLAWGVINMEPDYQLKEHFHSRYSLRTGYKNPQVDELLDNARTSMEDAKARDFYFKAQKLIWDDSPWLWIYYQPLINGQSKRLKGYAPKPDEYEMFNQAQLT